MSRDIHKKPFDEGTKAKLAIFRDYLKEWLPVFFAKKEIYYPQINIFDFFSGPGTDGNGNLGTPLIILEELESYIKYINAKNLIVNLYFNEYDKSKFEILNNLLQEEKYKRLPVNINTANLDFKIAFENEYPNMGLKGNANLLFLDQTGVKHITEEVFRKIINLKQTDFLFFISSSTIKRFSDHPNITQHIKLDEKKVDETPYHKIHRLVLEYYKSLIPKNKEYYLAQFSLKKNAGLYGLIFGSSHPLGIEKFLNTCWNVDKERGEANFDIDEDNIIPGQFDLFSGKPQRPKKLEYFESELKKHIFNFSLKTDKDVYLFTISNGIKTQICKQIFKSLIAEKKIERNNFDFSSKVCKKNAKITTIEFKKDGSVKH
jgi:three-Cys-motif partner protein